MFSYIEPSGPKDAKIVICGEAPGAEEERQGAFFVGPTGRMLDQFLSIAGIRRSDCYLTNVSKQKPPGNDFKTMYYSKLTGEPKEELIEARNRLIDEINDIKPNLTVALGNEALKALTGKDGITLWRGSILDSPVGKVIGTIHPAKVLRDWMDYAACLFDYHKIAGDMEFPELRLPNPVLQTAPTFSQVEWAYREQLKPAKIIAFDIETVNQEIDCIGFAPTPDYAICIPLMYTNGVPYWPENQENEIWRWIADLLGDKAIGKVAQNANYDITYLERHGCIFRNLAMDTMNAHHCVYPETPKGLDFLCSVYTRYPYYKDQSLVNRWPYNATDAVVTRVCKDEIDKELEDFGTKEFYYSLVNEIVLPYKKVADTGILVDLNMKDKITKELETVRTEQMEKLHSLVGEKINPDSPKQVATLLYETLRLDKVYKRDTGNNAVPKVTTDEEALKGLLKKYCEKPKTADILKTLLELRSLSKELNTYAKALVDPDGRIRTTYKVSGTETGRLASNKAITGTGLNLQNITNGPIREGCGYGIRSYVIADRTGDFLLEGDLQGADARIVAWLSQDSGLMYLFSSGQDIHSVNASLFFSVPLEEMLARKKEPHYNDLRQAAKKCGHAANYGSGPRTLAKEVGIPEREARRLLNMYLGRYPRINTWHTNIQEQLKANRTIGTPLGRKRMFFGRWGDDLFKEAYAYVPQSTVADIIHIGFLGIYREIEETGLDKEGIRVVMNNHDAIAINIPKSLIESVGIPLMKRHMEFPIKFSAGVMTIPVEFKSGPNWFDMKKVG